MRLSVDPAAPQLCLGVVSAALMLCCSGEATSEYGRAANPSAERSTGVRQSSSSGNEVDTRSHSDAGAKAETTGSEDSAITDDPTEAATPQIIDPVGASGDLTSEPEPSDERPERADWETSLELGPDGWLDSRDHYCTHREGRVGAFDVWADDRGVFTLYVAECNPFADLCEADRSGASIFFNDGTGWQFLYGKSYVQGPLTIGGVPSGPLYLAGGVNSVGGLYVYDEQLTLGTSEFTPRELFTVHDSSVFAIAGTALWQGNEGSWKLAADFPEHPRGLHDVWADEDSVLVATADRGIYRKSHSETALDRVPNVPAGDYTTIWGYRDQIFAGNTAGELIHYDGSRWNRLNTRLDGPLEDIWGAEGVVYFISKRAFGRYSETGGVEIIHRIDDEAVAGEFGNVALWGRSPSEVFLSAYDDRLRNHACGGAIMLWFDGIQLRRF